MFVVCSFLFFCFSDKTGGIFLRYGCGHCSCGDCIALAVDCSVCLTPPQSSSNEPVVDNTLTLRAVNAVNLLNVFQNEFHIDGNVFFIISCPLYLA